jgi:hypothetical protein
MNVDERSSLAQRLQLELASLLIVHLGFHLGMAAGWD